MILAGVPGELTTMAGRRFRNQIDKVAGNSIPGVKTIIAGLSNDYSYYITTFEEYQVSMPLLYLILFKNLFKNLGDHIDIRFNDMRAQQQFTDLILYRLI